MSLICAVMGVYYSLRHWNPWTALGWVPVDGHAYLGEPPEPPCLRTLWSDRVSQAGALLRRLNAQQERLDRIKATPSSSHGSETSCDRCPHPVSGTR